MLQTQNNEEKEVLLPQILTKDLIKELIRNASLPTLTRVFAVGSDFTSAYYLSKLGSAGLAASGFITVYTNFLKTTLASSMFSVSLNVREKLKQNKPEKLNSSFHNGLTLAIIESATACTLTYFYPNILDLLRQPKDSINIVRTFLNQYLWGLPSNITLFMFISFAKGLQLPEAIFIHIVPSKILLSLLGYPITLGKWGVPSMGAAGLGIVYSGTTSLAVISFGLYYLFSKLRNKHNLLKSSVNDFCNDFKKIGTDAIRLGSLASFEYIFLLANTLYCGRFGINALAAAEIANQYSLLLSIPVHNLSQASGVIVKKYFCSENKQLITKFSLFTYASSASLSIINLILTYALKKQMVGLFLNFESNNAAFQTAEELIVINAWAQIALTLRNMSSGLLEGAGKTNIPPIISFFTDIIIGGTTTYLLSSVFNLEAKGVFLARAISFSIGAAAEIVSWINVKNKSTNEITAVSINKDEKDESDKKQKSKNLFSFWKSYENKKELDADVDEDDVINNKKCCLCNIL